MERWKSGREEKVDKLESMEGRKSGRNKGWIEEKVEDWRPRRSEVRKDRKVDRKKDKKYENRENRKPARQKIAKRSKKAIVTWTEVTSVHVV